MISNKGLWWVLVQFWSVRFLQGPFMGNNWRSLHFPTLSGWTLLDCHWTLVWKIWWKWVRMGVIFWWLSNGQIPKNTKKSLELIAYKSWYTLFWSDFWAEFRYVEWLVIQWCDTLPFWSNSVIYDLNWIFELNSNMLECLII